MKKFSIYVILLAAVLAVGCRKDRYDSELLDKDPWMYDYTLPVPLQFNISNSLQTKALIDDATDLKNDIDNNEDRYIGIFGLPKNKYVAETETTAAQYEWADNNYCFWNLKGTINDEGNSIQFVENGENKLYYYPTSSVYNYSFFVYYPTDAIIIDSENEANNIGCYHPKSDGSYSTDVLTATVNIDGVSDIMWAKSIAGTAGDNGEYEGYNARYIRNNGEKPSLKFEHLLTAIQFKIKYEASSSSSSKQPIKITSFVFNNVDTKATFYLAHRSTTSYDKFQGYLKTTSVKDNITVPSLYPEMDIANTDDTEVSAENGKLFCTAMMYAGRRYIDSENSNGDPVYKVADTRNEYSVTINYTVGEGNSVQSNALNINLKNADNFLPGNKYSVTIIVKGSEELSFDISINTWNPSNMTSGDIILDETEDGSDVDFSGNGG